MLKRAAWYQSVALNAYWFGTSFMWNSLHPIVLPLILLPLTTEATKNTGYGLLTFVGLIIALIVQPISGALSDRTRHRLGRRRPWIIGGAALSLVCLMAMAVAQSYWTVALSYILLQFSSNLGHGPSHGLIPDTVPSDRRGMAAGLKNLFDMAGVIVAARVASRLMAGQTASYLPAFTAIGGVLLVSATLTVVSVREQPTLGLCQRRGQTIMGQLRATFRVDLKGQRDYARLLLARFCVLLGTFSVQSFALYYFRDALALPAPERVMGNIMAAIGLSITLSAYPAGILSERWGRKGLSVAACALTGLGMGLLALMRDMTGLWILGCLIGLGMGIFASANWAWATDLVPVAEAGKYLGLANLATAGSAAVARLLGPAIDLLNARSANVGYTMVFILATVGALVGLLLTLGINDPRSPLKRYRSRYSIDVTGV